MNINEVTMSVLHIFDYSLQNIMGLIVDEMGKASALAQDLSVPITSARNLINSDHIIYTMTENNTSG